MHSGSDTKSSLRRRFFDEHAHGWEDRCYPPEKRKLLAELIEAFDVRPNQKVLDVGCGEGVLVPYLLERLGTSGFIVELDASLEMLRGAQRKSQRQIQCVWAPAELMPLPDADFDAVYCFAVFPHFTDPKKALLQIHRVLKPEGRLVVAHLLGREEIARHHANSPSVIGDELPDEENMRSLMAETGFAVESITDRPGRYLLLAKRV